MGVEKSEIPAYRQAGEYRNSKQIPIGNQDIRKSGCRISGNQDIRKSENERILKPDALIS
jgi:hypothetical protein